MKRITKVAEAAEKRAEQIMQTNLAVINEVKEELKKHTKIDNENFVEVKESQNKTYKALESHMAKREETNNQVAFSLSQVDLSLKSINEHLGTLNGKVASQVEKIYALEKLDALARQDINFLKEAEGDHKDTAKDDFRIQADVEWLKKFVWVIITSLVGVIIGMITLVFK